MNLLHNIFSSKDLSLFLAEYLTPNDYDCLKSCSKFMHENCNDNAELIIKIYRSYYGDRLFIYHLIRSSISRKIVFSAILKYKWLIPRFVGQQLFQEPKLIATSRKEIKSLKQLLQNTFERFELDPAITDEQIQKIFLSLSAGYYDIINNAVDFNDRHELITEFFKTNGLYAKTKFSFLEKVVRMFVLYRNEIRIYFKMTGIHMTRYFKDCFKIPAFEFVQLFMDVCGLARLGPTFSLRLLFDLIQLVNNCNANVGLNEVDLFYAVLCYKPCNTIQQTASLLESLGFFRHQKFIKVLLNHLVEFNFESFPISSQSLKYHSCSKFNNFGPLIKILSSINEPAVSEALTNFYEKPNTFAEVTEGQFCFHSYLIKKKLNERLKKQLLRNMIRLKRTEHQSCYIFIHFSVQIEQLLSFTYENVMFCKALLVYKMLDKVFIKNYSRLHGVCFTMNLLNVLYLNVGESDLHQIVIGYFSFLYRKYTKNVDLEDGTFKSFVNTILRRGNKKDINLMLKGLNVNIIVDENINANVIIKKLTIQENSKVKKSNA